MEIQDSIQKILQGESVVAERFYECYFRCHPEARRFFDGIDMRRQAVMLNMALLLVEHHHGKRYPATEHYLKVLGHTHASRRGVPVEAYAPFRDCLLETLAEFHGADWDENLAAQWRAALDLAIATMLQGHEGIYSV